MTSKPKMANKLHIAASCGETKEVRNLVDAGADVNARDKQGFSPLQCAARSDHEDTARYLLSRGAETDLFGAAGLGDDKMALSLLSKGEKINCRDVDGRTPLHWATVNDHAKTITLLISRGADIDARSRNGRTPLHDAAEFHSIEAVRVLLRAGAKVNAQDNEGQSPLATAVDWYSPPEIDTERLLITSGADLNMANNDGYTPLHLAVRYGALDLARYFISVGGKEDIHIACGLGGDDLVRRFLASGTKIESKDPQGLTPLHWAAENGQLTVLKLLIPRGVSVEVADNEGRTPLHLAVYGPRGWCKACQHGVIPHYFDDSRRCKVVELLLTNGANPNRVDPWLGKVPLEEAREEGYRRIAKVLEKYNGR